eukprot:scaffold10851_cov129-Cyclotella_meneghiniana.AAC.4
MSLPRVAITMERLNSESDAGGSSDGSSNGVKNDVYQPRNSDADSGDDSHSHDVDEEVPGEACDGRRYEDIITQLEEEESEELNAAIENEAEMVNESDGGELLVDATFSESKMAEMKSMFVTDPEGNQVHKKALLKSLNLGKSLKKSFDRTKRVRDEARKRNVSQESVVTRAFLYSHDTSADPNSGVDRLSYGDLCCIIIQSKTGRRHMVICKLQRFGQVKQAPATELWWNKSNGAYRAAVNIIATAECRNNVDKLCLRPSGEILSSLPSVHSSCIEPISACMESIETSPGVILDYSVLPVSDLESVFETLCLREFHSKPHNVNDTKPIVVNGKTPFIMSSENTRSLSRSEILCHLCDPPKRHKYKQDLTQSCRGPPDVTDLSQ